MLTRLTNINEDYLPSLIVEVDMCLSVNASYEYQEIPLNVNS